MYINIYITAYAASSEFTLRFFYPAKLPSLAQRPEIEICIT